jgi:hypothetical protein
VKKGSEEAEALAPASPDQTKRVLAVRQRFPDDRKFMEWIVALLAAHPRAPKKGPGRPRKPGFILRRDRDWRIVNQAMGESLDRNIPLRQALRPYIKLHYSKKTQGLALRRLEDLARAYEKGPGKHVTWIIWREGKRVLVIPPGTKRQDRVRMRQEVK